MKVKKYRYFSADFETTVFKGQEYTEVWASAIVELYTENVEVFNSIDGLWNYLLRVGENSIVYFHNLKFDGQFWLYFLMQKKHFKQAYIKDGDNEFNIKFLKDRLMTNNTFKYSISNMGQWYSIVIKVNDFYIELRDSYKLLPFSVKTIGKSFNTKHKKSTIEYTGFRYAGGVITDEEREYIANDILVVKEALEVMFNEGHNSLTIGSCCLKEFKHTLSDEDYRTNFPDLYNISIKKTYGAKNAGEYIRKSYHGGWCYLVKGKESKVYKDGCTADVNSLYPSMMSSESGNRYPIGKPTFWVGNIPDIALQPDKYYFVRLSTRFKIKPGKLPFIQIKNTSMYKGNESLTTSDIYDNVTGEYFDCYYDFDGNLQPATPTLTMTMTDYELFKKHYDLYDTKILDGCYFDTTIGIFDKYIEKYKKIKMENKGALRTLAKLFLNNLYGKLASSPNSSFKVAYIKENGVVGFMNISDSSKKPGYIACGSAITSYARNFTISTAQLNYYGKDKPGFIYADTDSIHCDLQPHELKGVPIHDTNFCCWKLESNWDCGYYVRQKTYIEHITVEDGEKIDTPYYDIKCAGMPARCKDLFIMSLTQNYDNTTLNDNEQEFVKIKRQLTDFNVGLCVPGKLMPKTIIGGVVLNDTNYEMR